MADVVLDTPPPVIQSPRYQRIILWVLATGAFLATLGPAVLFLQFGLPETWGSYAATVGLLLMATGVGLAHPLRSLSILTRASGGGTTYDRRKHWRQVKVASIQLNLLLIIGGILLAGALLDRLDLIVATVQVPAVVRLTYLLCTVFAVNVFVAFYYAARIRDERERTGGVTNAFLGLALAATAAFAFIAAGASDGRFASVGGLELGAQDVPFLLLTACVALGLGLFVSRDMPTLYALFAEEREFYRGHDAYTSRRKSVVLPIAAAFALLFLLLLVFLVLQVGLAGLVTEAPRNVLFLGTIGIVALSLVVSAWVTFSIARSEDPVLLFRMKASAERRREVLLLGTSAVFALLFVVVAVLLATDRGPAWLPLRGSLWIDFLVFAMLVLLGPYGFYVGRQRKRIRDVEERFPDFLRDLAASRRAGQTLESAVRVAAKGEYGALTPEIAKMADQLSWNVAFDEVLLRFSHRVRTPLIERAVSLIVAAGKTGGQVADILMTAATDVREIKNLEVDRRNAMTLYTVVIYVTFLVFLLIVAVLYGTFVPKLVETTEAAQKLGSTGAAGLSLSTLPLSTFRVFYFLAAVVQGIGNGFVAGILESGRPALGMRHAFIMVLTSYATFAFFL